MRRFLYLMILIAAGVLAACSDFDDSALNKRLEDFKDRIAKLQTRITALNDQLADLSELTNGNVITGFTTDADGNYVINYKTSKDEIQRVVIATIDQMINVPLLGVELGDNNIYYWTITTEGTTTRLKGADQQDVPVSGYTPVVAVDSEGYWTVNGVRITDASDRPIEANDGETCIFKGLERNANGDLQLTLGNGTVITLPVQQVLNLKLSSAINTTVLTTATPLELTYELTGEHAADALVGIAEAENLTATLDKATKQVSVQFPSNFTEGHLILVAYDMAEHTVIRPVFFHKAASDRIEIRTAEELVQFAADVNAATGAEGMKVLLMNDIDMKNSTTWTPIGNGTFTGLVSGDHVSSYTGSAFKGTFDGQDYAIRNLKMQATLSGDGAIYGLFGILDHATISNLNIGTETGDTGSFTVAGNGATDTGVIAGACISSTIQSCNSYIPMTCNGNGAAALRMTMALVGFVYGDLTEENISKLIDLKNYGKIKATAGANNVNGATSVQIGGIAGLSNGAKASTFKNRISGCINYGDMESATARTSGIVAAANMHTEIVGCENRGNQTNTCPLSTGGRPGNITCIMGPDTKIDGCTNYGDLICTNSSTQAGGLVCLVNDNSVEVNNSANYGRIISDLTTYRGTLIANFSKFAKVDNNIAGGSIGAYNGGTYQMIELTEDNYMDYIGKYTETNQSKITNTQFGGNSSDAKGIRTAADLVAFATAVNAGQSTAEWEDSEGGINLLADIDLKDVTTWTPIGNGSFTIVSNDIVTSGVVFKGHFNGLGHKIKNLKLVSNGTTAGETYGLFGALGTGAVVENFVIDGSCSLTVTASASISSGVVAGLVYDATVRDITNNAPMTFEGTAAGGTHMNMAIIGYTFAQTAGVTIDSVHNLGKITAENKGGNTAAGATAYHAAGIVGFAQALNTSGDCVNTISNCTNYGDMVSATPRTSGIVAAANRSTQLINCVNYGNQTNNFSVSGGGRLGMITCNMGSNTSMNGCKNYGNLTSTTAARCGGLTLLSNTATFENCANYGIILTDDAKRGLFWGYNNDVAKWRNCTAGGKVGTYNGGSPVFDSYDEANQINYLGVQGANKSTLEAISYEIGSTGAGGNDSEAQLRILFIGNSFTKDAVEHLPGLLAAAGLDKVKLTHMYYGGRTVPEYNNGFSTVSDYHCYQCAPGATSWIDVSGKSLREIAASEQWDIVTIQEHTGNSCAWVWNATEKEALQGLINNVKATQSGAMPKFYYILSQAYFDMGKIGTAQQPYKSFTTQDEMYAVIVAQAKKIMAEVSFNDIIATGTVLQNLRTSSLDNTMNLTCDGYHMDYGISRYAAACALFEKLISPAFSNTTLDTNTYRYSVSNTSSTAYSTPVTDANAPYALQAARYALTTPYEVTDMATFSVK